MRAETVFRLLFIVYCVEAGIFLCLTPWSPVWDRGALQLPWTLLRQMAIGTWVRSLLCGFGAVHLVWAIHDLDLVLRGEAAAGPGLEKT